MSVQTPSPDIDIIPKNRFMKYPRLAPAASLLLLNLATANAQIPVITQHPAPLALHSGQVAVFQGASTNALSYQWCRNGTNLALTERVSGVNNSVLSISPAIGADAGAYTLVASNSDGITISTPAHLFMDLALPSFTSLPLSRTNLAGATVSFSAEATGTGPISYQWVRYGEPVSDNGIFSGATTPSLQIAGVSGTNTGWYWLVASNAAGVVACNPARLSIETPGELGAALEYPQGEWTTGGSGGSWVPQAAITQDGTNGLRSPPIPFSSSTYIETTVYGPGQLSYYWTVSSELGYDPLSCQLDGVEMASISGELVPDFTRQTFAVGWGPHKVRWVFSVDHNKPGNLDAGFLDQVTFVPAAVVSLEAAVTGIPLPVRTYGSASWFGQTAVNHDGISAARSGYITHNQSTTLEDTVTGPGWISFSWKVSAEYADPLQFLVDGAAWDTIAGEVDWTNRMFHIPWGVHTLAWRYSKDYSKDVGSDAAWLDEISYTPVVLSDLTQSSDLLSSPWTSGGSLPWFGQNEYTSDGTDAVQSGPISHNQTSFLSTSLNGPGTLTFRWKVSSEYSDPLQFLVDAIEQNRIAGDVDWAPVTNVVRPGAHQLRWQYSKDYAISIGTDSGMLDAVAFVPAPPLPVALDAPELSWGSGGDGMWFPEMITTHDGSASAHSGDIGHSQSTTLSATVTGPGQLSYWWKVSSEYSDPLIFLVDDAERTRIGGDVGWSRCVYNISPGTHTLNWRYQKDGSIAQGADAGWVDQVTYTPLKPVATKPVVTSDTLSVTIATMDGFSYALECADALTSPMSWNATSAEVAGDGTSKMLSIPVVLPSKPQQFYRVRAWMRE